MDKTVDTSIKAFLLLLLIQLSHWMPHFFFGSEIIIPAAIFMLLYKPLGILTRRILRYIVLRKKSPEGSWIYIIYGETVRPTVYGMFTVRESAEGIRAENGCAWLYGCPSTPGNRQGVWHSTAASLEEDILSIFYTQNVLRPTGGEKPRKCSGVMELRLVPNDSGLKGEKALAEGSNFTGSGTMEVIKAKRVGKKATKGDLLLLVKKEFDLERWNAKDKESQIPGTVIYLKDRLAMDRFH